MYRVFGDLNSAVFNRNVGPAFLPHFNVPVIPCDRISDDESSSTRPLRGYAPKRS